MKKIKFFLLMSFALLTLAAFAHEKTDSVKVYGECGMCKARIEKAVSSIEGVKKASWDEDTKMLTVTYNADKTTLDAIQQKAAAVGHDTEKFPADNAVYKKLPGCCRYERKTDSPAKNQPKATDSHAGHNH